MSRDIFKHDFGVYLGLDENVYHSDMSLSSTGARKLLKSPYKFWHSSWLNPDYDPATSGAKDKRKVGKYFHCALFEPERFAAEFYEADVGKWDIGKKMLSRSEWRDVTEAVAAVRANSRINKMLSGGLAEVSIFFPYAGVNWRVRADYVVAFGSDLWLVDYKTVPDIDLANLRWSIKRWGYATQAAIYREGFRWAMQEMAAGKLDIFGSDDAEMALLESMLLEKTDVHWINLFQERTPSEPYVFAPYRLTAPILDLALEDVRRASRIYAENLAAYKDSPWPSRESDMIEDIFLEDLPTSI